MDVGLRSESRDCGNALRAIKVTTAAVGCVALFLTTAWLGGRRFAGAFTPVESSQLLLAAIPFIVLCSLVIRLPVQTRPARTAERIWLYAGSLLVVTATLVVTDVRVQAPWACGLLWSSVIAAEAWIFTRFLRPVASSNPAGPPVELTRGGQAEQGNAVVDEALSDFQEGSDQDHERLDQDVIQRIERSLSPTMGEIVHGTCRARFAAGQRQESVHLAFCPPLKGVPTIEVETADGPAASVKVALVVPHGARFDIRLDEAAVEATDVLIEFFAQVSRD